MQRIFCIFIIFICFLSLQSCAMTKKYGPYKGRVVDAETGQPIEGAVVFFQCSTMMGTPAGQTFYYAGGKDVLTDEDGEFFIEYRVLTFRPFHFWDNEPDFIIFKPGYGVFPGHPNSTVDIPRKGRKRVFAANTYVTISLPKLKTIEERKTNLRNIFIFSKKPYETCPNLFRLRNFESVQVGLQPYSNPK